MPLDRKPPAAVRRQLRCEVGFGCPVPGCGKPFLEWHHFDPPWHEREHHDPTGMIALCGEHHKTADRGVFSKGELNAWKKSTSVGDVRATFPWAKREFLVRLGGVYHGGSQVAFAVNDQPVIELKRQENGRLTLSFILKAIDGTTLLAMEENMFVAYPEKLHDLEVDTGPTKVKAWFAERKVGLELSFNRLTVDELGAILELDRQRGEEVGKAMRMKMLADLPDHIKELLRENDNTPPSWIDSLPEPLRTARLSKDPVGTMVKEWAKANCLDDEGCVPLIDFKSMTIHETGRCIVIRDGIREGEGHISYSFLADNKQGSFNL